MSVLVVAFPVSVFSDLWSHELQKVGGFEALDENDRDSGRKDSDSGRKDTTALNKSGMPQQNYQSTANSGDVVVMDRQDLQQIAQCLQTIRENEQAVKSILRKYHQEDIF